MHRQPRDLQCGAFQCCAETGPARQAAPVRSAAFCCFVGRGKVAVSRYWEAAFSFAFFSSRPWRAKTFNAALARSASSWRCGGSAAIASSGK
jgi:hypothetical protein